MPVKSTRVLVGLDRAIVSSPFTYNKLVHVQSASPVSNIFIGGPDVTIENGIALTAVETLKVMLNVDDTLFAVSDTENSIVKVLEIT